MSLFLQVYEGTTDRLDGRRPAMLQLGKAELQLVQGALALGAGQGDVSGRADRVKQARASAVACSSEG